MNQLLVGQITPLDQLRLRRALRQLCDAGDGTLAVFQIGEWREYDGNDGLLPRRLPSAKCTVPSPGVVRTDSGRIDGVGQRVRLAGEYTYGSLWLLGSPLPVSALFAAFRAASETIEDVLVPLA